MPLFALLFTIMLAQATQPAPQPTATPDWHVYNDPAMHFVAPAGFLPVGQRQVPLDKLSDDPVVVAGWIYPKQDHQRRLIIEQESFSGSAGDFADAFKGQLRDQTDSSFFKDEENITLSNGMPAVFFTMNSGEGFDAKKSFFIVWADGERGVAVGIQTSLEDIDSETARRLMLTDLSAVRYPLNNQ